MATSKEKRKAKFLADLIASIENTDRHFNMDQWTTDFCDYGPATCGTASCLAGHVAAIRPKLAKQYYKEGTVQPSHLARAIYSHETGENCLLDFYGDNLPGGPNSRDKVTRQQAVAHVRGTSRTWKQLESVPELW